MTPTTATPQMTDEQIKEFIIGLKSMIQSSSYLAKTAGMPDPYADGREFANSFISPGKDKAYYEGVVETVGKMINLFGDSISQEQKMLLVVCVAEAGDLYLSSNPIENDVVEGLAPVAEEMKSPKRSKKSA